MSRAGLLTIWYDGFGASLSGRASVPDPLGQDSDEDRLVDAVGQELRDRNGKSTATAVRVLWTGDHLDAVRRLQESIVGPARTAVNDHVLS